MRKPGTRMFQKNMSIRSEGGMFPFQDKVRSEKFFDDQVVGVASPFELVFTGGICPGFWRKIVDQSFRLAGISV